MPPKDTVAPTKSAETAQVVAETEAEMRERIQAEIRAEMLAEQQAALEASKPKPGASVQLGALSEAMGIPATTVVCDPALCPPTHVNMHTVDDRRVACTTGRVYLFAKGQNLYVNLEDRDTCASHGAGVL